MKNIGLRFAIALLAVLGAVSTAQGQVPPLVYKYSSRAPTEADGTGVFQRGFRAAALGQGGGYTVPAASSPAWDLGNHVGLGRALEMGNPNDPTVFISTTSDFALAQRIGRVMALSANPIEKRYWVYDIVPGLSFVDVAATYRRTLAAIVEGPLTQRLVALQADEDVFTNMSEYAAFIEINVRRVIRGREINALTGEVIATEENPNFNPLLVPDVHENTYPLGTVRGQYYTANVLGTPFASVWDTVLGTPSENYVSHDFLCAAIPPSGNNRTARSTDAVESADSDWTEECPNFPQTVAGTIPLNTSAGFGSITNVTSAVPVGQFRQWVDVDGDGLADLCVLYAGSVVCYRQTASTNPEYGEQGMFETVIFRGAISETPSHYESFAFVNVTGQPGDIAFCWANSNVNGTRYDIKCDNYPKSSNAKITPVPIEFGAQPSQYYGGGQWVDGLTGNHRPAFCSVAPYNKNFYMLCSVYPGTAPAGSGSAIIPDLFSDNGTPGSQYWADVKGDGTQAYCRVDATDHLRCLPFNTNNGAFGTDFESSEELETRYYQPTAAWSADVNGDGKADYCRAIPGANPALESVLCLLSTGSGFSREVSTPTVAKGYPNTGAMVDIDGDGYADYCRLTKAPKPADPTKPAQMSCLINDRNSFNTSIDSSSYNVQLNAGSVEFGELAWLPANGRQIGHYCRGRADNSLACTAIY